MEGRAVTLLDKLWPILILTSIGPVVGQEFCADSKKFCDGYCCNSGQCCLYYHETWWFWLMWACIFLILSCCFYQREKICKRWRPQNRTTCANSSHPYQHIISTTTIIPIPSDSVRLPSYDEVPILPKGPPPDYNQVYLNPVLPVRSTCINQRHADEIEEPDWEIPEGIPPPPYSVSEVPAQALQTS